MKLPEIREPDAPADVAAIYADIKNACGVPLINLIWRHFAALPGVLPWAWRAVRPVVTSAPMNAARQRLAARIPLPDKLAADEKAWRDVVPQAGDRARIGAVVAAYTRGNLTNLVALTALRLRLQRPAAPACVVPACNVPQAGILPIDALPRLADLSPEAATSVRLLAARHVGTGGVVPSLYLHLAHWPALLAVLPSWLAEIYAPGVLEASSETTRQLAEHQAAALLPAWMPPPAGAEAGVATALELFTRHVIPDLLPVCLALSRSHAAIETP